MTQPVCEVLLTEAPIASPPQTFPEEAGGIVDFWGVVRAIEDGREINGIEYEAHRTMAEHQLRAIAEQAARDFSLKHITISHRTGFVAAGEASLFVRVCSRHRSAAFEASAWIVEELKKRAPIWKHVRFSSGAEATSAAA
ncbi:MAG: molybdenum cofactor biosynthesis protein MoaE [Chthoniobacterales bacterium]